MPTTNRKFFSAVSPTLIIGIVVILVVVGYSIITALPFFLGSHITIEEPFDTSYGTTRIQGTALRVSKLSLNGLDIPLDSQGTFSVERSYPKGYTVLILTAEDRFGRVEEKNITFITNSKNHVSEKESEGRNTTGEAASDSLN